MPITFSTLISVAGSYSNGRLTIFPILGRLVVDSLMFVYLNNCPFFRFLILSLAQSPRSGITRFFLKAPNTYYQNALQKVCINFLESVLWYVVSDTSFVWYLSFLLFIFASFLRKIWYFIVWLHFFDYWKWKSLIYTYINCFLLVNYLNVFFVNLFFRDFFNEWRL